MYAQAIQRTPHLLWKGNCRAIKELAEEAKRKDITLADIENAFNNIPVPGTGNPCTLKDSLAGWFGSAKTFREYMQEKLGEDNLQEYLYGPLGASAQAG